MKWTTCSSVNNINNNYNKFFLDILGLFKIQNTRDAESFLASSKRKHLSGHDGVYMYCPIT